MKQRHKKRLLAEINVVPYIDVMLVLLVIFMVTTPMMNQGVDIELPQASAKPLTTQSEPIIVSVDTQGLLYLNIANEPEKPIDAAALATRITAELQRAKMAGEQKNVFIKGDTGVSYGKIMEAMVLLQQSGVERIGLMTQPVPENSTG